MSEQGATLNDLLSGNIPLRSNQSLMEPLLRDGHDFVSVALSGQVVPGQGFLRAFMDVVIGLNSAKLDLMVGDLGPSSGSMWRLASLLRDRYEAWRCTIALTASPGSSLVALGADELEMSPAACLTASLTTEPGQADPRMVARRALESRLDVEADTKRIDRVLGEIEAAAAGHLPLTPRDCEGRLGLTVVRPDAARWKAIEALHEYYREMMAVEGDLTVEGQRFAVTYDGFIDAPGSRRVLLRIVRTDERGKPVAGRPSLNRWITPHGGELVLGKELTIG
ncbi:MAG: hypothetical protein KC613_24045 [Myxococcales bacterium]|nr:hypothetical protein [Myxococcales bacterium]MCB9522198.1 hypothetical protein [Myxococcales bacterium]